MILYTPMPLELVLDGLDAYRPQYEEVTVRGHKVVVERTGVNQAKLVRLLSTNPNDFLDPSFFPGAIITFTGKTK
ncbi:MAG TPA: hypothetical protein GXX50_00050 [Firmicutes bacterium]|jgi:hypothetical protein|uniref:YlzJ-like family protein n=1 Tax=Gelria sp. Kuro-4 TaxID=2796927 RepID=UPI0019AA1A95|nr:YlzJ-like family protein [Gelria sp. Kuro-4]MDI3523003.1 hypothetical protein [Bacillota bacterium]MDK2927993.1 hypothetical protein [Bacillota bacterium]BCV24998.1 hypothetical protein kuro4_17710 [Gelria sp. Kuro-4]HHV56143.1 hypothetical protein [Bacillota bacterium]